MPKKTYLPGEPVPKGPWMSSLETLLGVDFEGYPAHGQKVRRGAKGRIEKLPFPWKPKGGLKAFMKLGPVLNLLGLGVGAWEISRAMGLKGERELVEGMPPRSTESFLQEIEERHRLAAAESRLMRNDPEAYAALRGAMSGARQPELATGEFVVGGPTARSVSRSDVQRALGSII